MTRRICLVLIGRLNHDRSAGRATNHRKVPCNREADSLRCKGQAVKQKWDFPPCIEKMDAGQRHERSTDCSGISGSPRLRVKKDKVSGLLVASGITK